MAVDLRQTHFRFGRNSGLEASHAWLGNENANISFRVETTFLLRFCIQEAGGTAINNVDNQFTYNLNGAGWNNITTTSSVVKAVASNCFSDIAHCTQRLSGTGTFETSASGCTVDGLSGGGVNDIAASGCSETECSLQIVSADVNNGDTIQFRITSPDGTITYTVTPTLTVIKETLSFSSALAFVGSALRLLMNSVRTNASSISFSGSVSGVFSYAFQYFVGTVTYVYQKAATQARTVGGTLPISGVFIRLAEKLRTKSGAINLAGTLTRLINNAFRTIGGGLTLGGVPTRLINKLTRTYSGTSSFSGILSRKSNLWRAFDGFISFAGIVTRLINKLTRTYGGTVTLVGDLRRLINNLTRTYSGSITPSGLPSRLINNLTRAYSGTLGFVGKAISSLNSKDLLRAYSGEISFSGLLRKGLFRTLQAANLTISHSRSWIKGLFRTVGSASISFSGKLNRLHELTIDWTVLNFSGEHLHYSILRKFKGGVLSFSSFLNKHVYNTKSSSLSFSGMYSYVKSFIQQNYSETRNGGQTFSGVARRLVNVTRTVRGYLPPLLGLQAYQGFLSFIGSASTSKKLLARVKSGVLSFGGSATNLFIGGILRTFEGAISPAGVIAFIEVWKFGRISAALSFVGQVAGVLFVTGRYTAVGTWTGAGAVVRRLTSARKYVSTLSISGSLSKQFSCFERYVGYLSLNSILEFVKTGGAAAISVLEDGLISITGTSSRRVQLAMAYSGGTSFSTGYTHQSGFFRELFSGVHPYAADIGGGAGVTGGEFMMDMTLGV
jgi:hypothetical protein